MPNGRCTDTDILIKLRRQLPTPEHASHLLHPATTSANLTGTTYRIASGGARAQQPGTTLTQNETPANISILNPVIRDR